MSSFCRGQRLDNNLVLNYVESVRVKSPLRYPIRAAANLTGLSIDTLRAWERRYQAVTPGRDARGRAYSQRDIRRLILLRELVDAGHAIGQVASLEDEKLTRLLAAPVDSANKSQRNSAKKSTQKTIQAGAGKMGASLESIVSAIESYDYAMVNAELGRLALLLPVQEFVEEAVLPLMRIVGERWQEGTLSVAQEHMTSSIFRNLLGGMVRLRPSASKSSRILFATPAGEGHEFGILAAAMLAVGAGFEAMYFGPNLPASDIISVMARTAPRAIVLGLKASRPTAETIDELRRVAAGLPRRSELWLGGSAVKRVLSQIPKGRVMALEDFASYELQLERLKKENP